MKKAFFIDIDGTAAVNGVIPRENAEAVNEATAKGHYVFISTGRVGCNFLGDILDSADWSGILYSLGAEIIFNNEIIWKKNIPENIVRIVAETVFKYGMYAVMGSGNSGIVLNGSADFPNSVSAYNISDFEKHFKEVSKMDIQGERLQELCDIIEKEANICRHTYDYCEIVAKGVSKSEGIGIVLSKLNIPRECCIAVGDSKNDADMIKYAGIGVAMGNACDDVKKIADVIAPRCEEFGVAKIIREFI